MLSDSELDSNSLVYRSVRNRDWLDDDTGLPLQATYLRYRDRDKRGLSVNIFEYFPVGDTELRNHIRAIAHINPHALLSAIVGCIAGIGLDIKLDDPEPDRSTTHANITDGRIVLPFWEDNDKEAERISDLLLECSLIRWYRASILAVHPEWESNVTPLERSEHPILSPSTPDTSAASLPPAE